MSVDEKAVEVAPPRPITPPAAEEERVHSIFFFLAIASVVIGALFVGASRVWADRAPLMVTFPLFNHTAVLSGSVTQHVDGDTLLALGAPAVKRFDDIRQTQAPSLLANKEILVTTDTITVGGKRTIVPAQYIVDVRDLHNLTSTQAWSFAGDNAADRSSAYSVNLPFDTAAGRYQIWLNEADRAVTFTRVGQPFTKDGVTVVRLQGHLDASPVDALYISQLSRAGLPGSATLEQLRPTAAALGADPGSAFPPMPPGLTGEEVAALSDPIPLDYTMTADINLLVEPRSGTIVAVEKADESFAARLDAAHLGAVGLVLDKHSGAPGAAAALAAVAKLAAAPRATMFDLSYAQTPESVRTMSEYAASQRDWMNRMTRVIPTTLFAVGLGVIALGVLFGVVAWRRRNAVYEYWWETEQ